MSFLQELKRRKVVRTTIAYLAAAFVTAQGVQLLVEGLGLPSWLLKTVLVVLVVALPLVVGLAWAFDLTPEGVAKTGDDSSISRLALPWRRIALPVTVSVLLLVAVLAFISLNRSKKPELNDKLIAVMPFRVAGDPQMAYLSEGMVDLLAAKLTGEGGPRAADPRAVLSAVKRASKADELDEKVATEIGAKLGAGSVLIGSIVGAPQQLEISAKILDHDGSVSAQGTQKGSADSLLVTVDRLVAKLLSLQAGEGPQHLELLTTTSLPALRAYLDGQAAYRNGRFTLAIQHFGRALDQDSTFALAGMGQWLATGWGEGPRVDFAKLRRILRSNRDRLGSVDKLFADALAGDDKQLTLAQRISDFEAVIKVVPDRADAWFEFADNMMHWGPLAGHMDALERADAGFSRVLQLDSTYFPAVLHRMDVAFLRGKPGEFRRLEPLRKRLDPSGDAALYHKSWRLHILRDSTGLKAERAAMDTMSSQRLYLIGLIGITGSGAVADGVNALEQMQAIATPDERKDALAQAAELYLNYGMPQRAARAFDDWLAVSDDDLIVHRLQVLAALYENGDTISAARAARNIESALQSERRMWLSVTALCALEQWRVWHGDTRTLRATLERLARVPKDSVLVKQEADVCAGVLVTVDAALRGSPDAAEKANALDRQLQKGPRMDARFRNAANIALARAAERAGDRRLAYKAMSRFTFLADAFLLSSTMYRESARLAALNGDRERAILHYTFYLNLHEMAELAVRTEVEAARKHLSQLAKER